jgi:hypothetical protein
MSAEQSGVSSLAQTKAIDAILHEIPAQIAAAVQRAQLGDTWTSVTEGIGPNLLPEVLSRVWQYIPVDERGIALCQSWVLPELSPLAKIGQDKWLQMFRTAGYHDEAEPAGRPEQTLIVLRRCRLPRRRGPRLVTGHARQHQRGEVRGVRRRRLGPLKLGHYSPAFSGWHRAAVPRAAAGPRFGR